MRTANNSPAQGDRAPEFMLPLLTGGEISLRDILAGGPALFVFYKISCPVCQLTLPYLERLHALGTLPIFAISQNNAEDTREFNRTYRITIPTMLDPEDSFPASNAYGITAVPTIFLVEANGKVGQAIYGWSKREIEALAARSGYSIFTQRDNVPEWKAG